MCYILYSYNKVREKKIVRKKCAFSGVAQWIEHWPANQRVTSLIPSQDTYLDCMYKCRCIYKSTSPNIYKYTHIYITYIYQEAVDFNILSVTDAFEKMIGVGASLKTRFPFIAPLTTSS